MDGTARTRAAPPELLLRTNAPAVRSGRRKPPQQRGVTMSNPIQNASNASAHSAQMEKISQLIQELQYGTIVIKVQDGRIVQIEKTEKYKI